MRINENQLVANQELYVFQNGDKVRYHNRGIYVTFAGKRRVLSTSVLNGGIREDLEGAFNFNCLGEQYVCEMLEDTYEKELMAEGKLLGLNGEKVTGLSTAAWVEFASIVNKEFRDLSVTAIVTGGIDKNAVRVGDEATYYEENGTFFMIDKKEQKTPGTINIILCINKELPAGVLARTLVTCTEAKVVAVEELMIGSLYGNGIATGSGTDGTIIISDVSCGSTLTDAGEHAKLGELIGKAVKEAVKEAISFQTGAGGPRQHKITERGKRYGITLASLWECYKENIIELKQFCQKEYTSLFEFEKEFSYFETNSTCVVWLSLYLHLLDQYRWGMLQWGELVRELKSLTVSLFQLKDEKMNTWLFQINYQNDLQSELVKQAQRCILAFVNQYNF